MAGNERAEDVIANFNNQNSEQIDINGNRKCRTKETSW